MKPTPKTKKFRAFTEAMQQIMRVSKAEIVEREKQAKEERANRRELKRK